MTEKYKKLLEEIISNECNNEGYYEICWNYDDEISPKTIKEAVLQSDCDPVDYISDVLVSLNEDYVCDHMLEIVRNKVYSSGDVDLILEYNNSESTFEDLYDAGYMGVEANVDELLDKTILDVNVIFGTPKEQNNDMGSIVNAFGSYCLPDTKHAVCYLNNMLSYLINQQGYKIEEVYDRLFANPKGWVETDNFVDSVVNEIVNNSSEAMSALCVLLKMSAHDYLTIVKRLKNKEKFTLKCDKNSTIGIFNKWSGCGGPFEIMLDKEFIVSSDNIKEMMLDDASDRYDYSVGSVYGMSSDAWRDRWSTSEECTSFDIENTMDFSKYEN